MHTQKHVLFLMMLLAVPQMINCSTTEQNEMLCMIYSDLSFYDLRGLELTSSNYEITDDDSNTYVFNMCSYVVSTDDYDLSCDATSNVYAYFTDSDGTCYDLSDDSINTVTTSVDTSGDAAVVSFSYFNGDTCSDSTYSVTVQATCDEDGATTDTATLVGVDTTDSCWPIISLTHKSACAAVSANTYLTYVANHQFILAPILIILGLAILFFGRQFFTYTLFVIGLLIGFVTTYLLYVMTNVLNEMMDIDVASSTSILFIKLLAALVIGLFIGFILTKMQYIAAGILGAWAGILIGFYFYQFCFATWVTSTILLVFCCLLFLVLVAIFMYKFYDLIIILLTSFIGAYSFVKGICVCIPAMPNEIEIYVAIVNDDSTIYTWYLFLMVFVYILFFVAGIIFQIKRKKQEQEKNDYIRAD